MIRILIVDDHAVVLQGLRMFLTLDPELVVVGEAQDGAEALERARELRPDVVLMDLVMPGMSGTETTELIRRELPDTEVVIMTSVLDDASVVAAVRAGATGYLLKDTRGEELCRALRAAAAGQVQLSPRAAALLAGKVAHPEVSPDALTPRELEVLRRVAAGDSNKTIALRLSIGEKTVKAHVSNLLGKLGVASRTQAALYAVHKGLADE